MDENKDNDNDFILVDENNSDEVEVVDEIIVEEELIEETPNKELPNIDKPTKKKGFRGSFMSYVAVALICSLLGGLASSYLAPKLYGGILPYPRDRKSVV